MRVFTQTLKYSKSQFGPKKIQSSDVEKPSSTVIVDYGYFKKTGIIDSLTNKLKDYNALFDAKRNVDGLTRKSFEISALEKYQNLIVLYQKRDYRHIGEYLSDDLYQKFESECRKKTKKEELNLNWNILFDANKAQIMQIRQHTEKMSQFRVSDRWYQFTVLFKNSKGEQIYNILEKHEKNKDFKFVKFDV